MSQEPVKYDARRIQLVQAWEAIRKRPGMYIGSTGQRGLHNLVFDAADRAVNEVAAGRADCVDVTLLADGGIRVADDGSGVPLGNAGDGGGPGIDAQLTRITVGTVRGGSQHRVVILGGLGLAVVNALSSRVVAEVRREGVRSVREYSRGVPVGTPGDAESADASGTVITFRPDAEIFETTECSFDALAERFRELAFLNADLDISLTDERRAAESRSLRFRFPGGVRDMVAFLDEPATALVHPEIIGFEREDSRMAGSMEVAWRWRDSGEERVRSYANSRATPGGGTHAQGFYDGVAVALTAYAREQRLLAGTDPGFGIERIGEGLTAVVSVKLEYPEFKGSTRGVLGNAAVRDCVRDAVQEHLGRWLAGNPQHAAAVIERIRQETH